jgi:hypothetical protein
MPSLPLSSLSLLVSLSINDLMDHGPTYIYFLYRSGKPCGMDQGSDFEYEFRARRIRVRGNFAHKLFSEIIHGSPVGDARP